MAALVAKFGGVVHLSASEVEAAQHVQVTITRNPATGEVSIRLNC